MENMIFIDESRATGIELWNRGVTNHHQQKKMKIRMRIKKKHEV
jgi:hypothetical protein